MLEWKGKIILNIRGQIKGRNYRAEGKDVD